MGQPLCGVGDANEIHASGEFGQGEFLLDLPAVKGGRYRLQDTSLHIYKLEAEVARLTKRSFEGTVVSSRVGKKGQGFPFRIWRWNDAGD